MKRFLVLTGMIAFLAPLSSYAADSAICSTLKNIKPVSSHYVQAVLDRADAGLEKARGEGADPGLGQYFFPWSERIGAAANSLIDSYMTLTIESQSLLDTTACLHVDMLLLDCKIDETQTELQTQLGKNSILGIVELESLLEFLQERKTHLVRGALNPDYEDPTWDKQWRFDPEKTDEPTTGAATEEAAPLCPFDSDYAPPANDGYGCDETVLARIEAYTPAAEELKSLTTLKEELKKYKSIATEFSDLEKELNSLYEEDATSPETPAPEEEVAGHKELNGCLSADTEDPRVRSLRSPFSYKKNELSILTEFLGKRAAEGMFRKQEGALRNADEIENEQEREDFEKGDNPVLQLFRNAARNFFRSVSTTQGKEESSIFPVATDSTLEMADALGDLRKSVGELSRLAEEKEGLRSFVIRFAYFLRRSCIYRSCNTSLERVLRTAYADACFPYTNGDFLKDSADDPRWKKCAAEACIAADGVTLPGNCKELGVGDSL